MKQGEGGLNEMKMFKWFGMFVNKMEYILAARQNDGWTGWNTLSVKTLKGRLLKNVEQEDWVDVANMAFFLWVRVYKKSDKETSYDRRR